jgi:hypothetical protein
VAQAQASSGAGGAPGYVVPMHRLCFLLGFPNMTEADRHILHQYASWIGRTLAEHGLPYCLTVARNVGYALCEIAPEGRRK